MTEKIQAMTIILMTSILFTGGVVPYSFGTYGDDSGDDSHGDDSHGDECGCDKPSIFTVTYDGPAADKIEIFKKKNDFNNNVVAKTFTVDDNGNPITSGSPITIHAENDLGKRKMSSNTFYKITEKDTGKEAKIVIHTSCSKPLFVDQVHDQKDSSEFEATLTIVGGYDLEWDDTMYKDYSCDIRDQQDDLFECDGTLINFDNNVETPHGTLLEQINLSTEFADNGVSLENPATGSNPQSTIAIYDSTPGSGADGDLEVNIGNLAIIPDNLGNPPNFEELSDSANGGDQVYTFNPPKNIRSFVWVDQDSSSETIHVTAKDSLGNVIHDIPTISPPVGNKNAKRIMFAADNTSELTFDYSGSGGVTNICITDPPVPEKGTIVVNKVVVGTVPVDPFNFEFEDPTPLVTPFDLNDGGSITFADLDPGDYKVRELAHVGYSLAIECTGAVIVLNGDEATITIVEDESVTCDFTNTETVDTTITLKKALTQDNTDELNEIDPALFQFFIQEVDEDGMPIGTEQEITMENQVINPGTYTMRESVEDGIEFVLVAGDTGCPSMLDNMEEFTIQEGEHLTCVIYNDDDRDASAAGGPGVVFHFETIMIKLSPAGGGPADCAVTGNVAPCIEILGEKTFIVRPDTSAASQDLTSTTLILLTVVPSSDFNLATQCTVSGLNAVGTAIDGFGVKCLDTTTGSTPFNDYNFNLALVETFKP